MRSTQPDSSWVGKIQYIRHPYFGNLSVIPYIKARLVFAEMSARAIEEGGFDLVAVDLPYFMNYEGWLDMPLKLFPYVSSLLVQNKDSLFVAFPFVPNDAACCSIASVRILQDNRNQIEYECIDDSNIIDYPYDCLAMPEVASIDDYFVFTDGLENYYAPVFNQLNESWNRMTETQQFFLKHRAGIMAERLRNLLRRGKKTLFVCEYKLWWLISKMLEHDSCDEKHFFSRWKGLKTALVLEDPYFFWAKGVMDDFPAVVFQFYNRLRTGMLGSFDKLNAINEMLGKFKKPAILKELGCPSIRKVASFHRYLNNRLTVNQRLTPALPDYIYDSALSCLGKRFAKEIAQQFLRYPYTDMEKVVSYLTLHEESIITGGNTFHIPDLSNCVFLYPFNTGQFHDRYEERIRLADIVRPSLTKREIEELQGINMTNWAVEKDYKLHEIACTNVRNIVERKRHSIVIKRSFGKIGDGINWKATIASKAVNEGAIYIKLRRHLGRRCNVHINEFTPIVFLFSENLSGDLRDTIHDSNITQRNIELKNADFPFDKNPPPDYVYSVFYTYADSEYMCNGHVIKRVISSITFLYTRHAMGIQRYEKITRRTGWYQCRIPPAEDAELKDFPISEIGISWAIKYAENAVLVVARDDWTPSGRLETFAMSKNVCIIPVPISGFSKGFIERLRSLYFISTPLKKHPGRERILERILE